MERRVRSAAEWVVESASEGPEGERDFDEEEGGDRGGDQGKYFQPGWTLGSPRGLTLGGQKRISEVYQDACGVYDDLIRCGKLRQVRYTRWEGGQV